MRFGCQFLLFGRLSCLGGRSFLSTAIDSRMWPPLSHGRAVEAWISEVDAAAAFRPLLLAFDL